MLLISQIEYFLYISTGGVCQQFAVFVHRAIIVLVENVRMPPCITIPTTLGHALEARVYAENPLKGFLPATGGLRRLREPKSPIAASDNSSTSSSDSDPRSEGGSGDVTVRVDTGVREGDEVREGLLACPFETCFRSVVFILFLRRSSFF